MARLSDLVATVSQVIGLPTATVQFYARLLREAGHIRQAGRGLSAARMDSDDAAALLLGLIAADQPKDTVEAFEKFIDLKFSGVYELFGWDREPKKESEFLNEFELHVDHTFSDLVSLLVEIHTNPIEEELTEIVTNESQRTLPFYFNRIDVTAIRPEGIGEVRIWESSQFLGTAKYGPKSRTEPAFRHGGLEVKRTFHLHVLQAVGDALIDEPGG